MKVFRPICGSLSLGFALALSACAARSRGQGDGPAAAALLLVPSSKEVAASVAREVEERDRQTVEETAAGFLRAGQAHLPEGFHLRSTVILDDHLVSEETGRPTAGVCYPPEYVIVLNRPMWLSSTKEQREVVLYHELGHCELDRRHTEGRRAGGGPKSLMNRNSVADVEFFIRDRDYYERELFSDYPSPIHYRKGDGTSGTIRPPSPSTPETTAQERPAK